MNVYCIEDGGESYWYAASDAATARALHRTLMYENAGLPRPTPEDEAHWSVALEPGDKILRFTDVEEAGPAGVPVEKTADGWAALMGEATFIATSEYPSTLGGRTCR